jgi:hypothetical protein
MRILRSQLVVNHTLQLFCHLTPPFFSKLLLDLRECLFALNESERVERINLNIAA